LSAEPDRRARGAGERVRVAVLGSTGSIGRQAVDVLAALPDQFHVVALAGRRDTDTLSRQAHLVGPRVVGWTSTRPAANPPALPPETDGIGGSDEILEALATRPDVDLVVVATGGTVGLRPVLSALAAGKVVATANKETLVAAGHLVMPLAAERARAVRADHPESPLASPLAWIRPIDSEHSAIWQCRAGEPLATLERLYLTASGGPFRDRSAEELARVTPEEALRHPTWRMGPKITIDSATLANKGLEVIEAHWLYDVDYDAIEVVIHPQSIVHSAVQFVDGSLKAQLGTPDMRLPIQYALTFPERRPSPAVPADLVAAGRLDFLPPDETRFPALRIAREAGRRGPRATTALIAADEVAVEQFLAGTLSFPGIAHVLEAAIERFGDAGAESRAPDVDEVVALDEEVRAWLTPGRVATLGAAPRAPR
jgi:1-deoxy-D-xylulose-5-phosphate reductoisomerase